MNPISSLITYLRSAKTELEKVSWPSREETVRYSVLVCAVCIATAVFFATVDFGLSKAVDGLIGLRNSQPAVTQPATETPDFQPQIEAVDKTGAPADVKIETIPLDGTEGGFKVQP